MRKSLVLITALMLVCSCAYAGTQTWTFDDGTTQGWNVTTNGSAAAFVASSATTNQLWQNYDGTNGVFMAMGGSSNYAGATMNIDATNSFLYTVTVRWTGGAGRLCQTGIGANLTGGSAISLYGGSQTGSDVKCTSGATTNSWSNAILANDGAAQMIIDYNYSTAGKMLLYFRPLTYSAPSNPLQEGQAFSVNVGIDPGTGTYYTVNQLWFGGRSGQSQLWSNTFFDNAILTSATVPEPGSMAALGSGLVGLIGFAIRRRK